MKPTLIIITPAAKTNNPLTKIVKLTNIAMRLTLSLAAISTPAIADVKNEGHFLKQRNNTIQLQTTTYTLGPEETVKTVAKKFNIDVDSLRRLNQFRHFSHGFDHLKTGDELDVPTLTQWQAQEKAAPISTPAETAATLASRTGSFLAGSPSHDAALSLATGAVASKANNELQQWLEQFGTARIRLDVDNDFSLKNSQMDLLLPLWEQKQNLIFAQGSVHRTDERTQSNLGFGLRHFTPTYMIGGNTFADYDLSRDHARMGSGIEYWRDFLKLSANGYLRLTNWKDTKDFDDYEERPANGWDLRTEAYLPVHPQLGAKLTYEKYYGDEVALFGKDHRQKNPYAITLGVNYTPIPLVTLNLEKRQGKNDENDTRLSIEINYQLGVPWVRQLSGDDVITRRTLSGNRYNLVERNNNIILAYRKKDSIRLNLLPQVKGSAGEKKSLGVRVDSSNGLKEIQWSAADLFAHNGKIVHNGGLDYQVVLPSYQYTSTPNANTYVIQGVALDNKGHSSNRAETQIIVNAPEINQHYSTFTPPDSLLPADGKSTQELTLTLRDAQQQFVDIPVEAIEITASSSEKNRAAAISPLKRVSAGVYHINITAGLAEELVTLIPTTGSLRLSSAKVQIRNGTSDATQSSFTIQPKEIAADNTTTSTLTFTAKDKTGNTLTGLKDQLSFAVTDSLGNTPTGNTVTVSAVSDAGKGVYIATLKGTVADTYSVVPQINGNAINALKDTVKINAIATFKDITATKGESISYTFGLNDKFPTMGFNGAFFTINVKDGLSRDFTWSANQSWVSVDNQGKVTLLKEASPSTKTVTISATPKKGGIVQTYSFTVNTWFTRAGENTWSDAVSACGNLGKSYSIPSYTKLTTSTRVGAAASGRAVGTLWGEWSHALFGPNMSSGFWAYEPNGNGGHYSVNMLQGVLKDDGFVISYTACSREL
ncbi:inverse autotransporter beta domain-containing protein [Serratia liquefaciens]